MNHTDMNYLCVPGSNDNKGVFATHMKQMCRKRKINAPLPKGYNCRNFRKTLLHMCQKYNFNMPKAFSERNNAGYTSRVTVQIPGSNKEVTFTVNAGTKNLAKISAYAEAVSAFTKACITKILHLNLSLIRLPVFVLSYFLIASLIT